MDWETVKAFLERYGYVAITLGTMLDQSGMQIFIVGGGALSRLSDKFSIFAVMAAGAAGNLLADSIFYGLGRWRAAWLRRWVRNRKSRMRLKLLRRWLNRHTLPLITFGRFFPWVGRFVPAAAGLQKVPLWKAAPSSLLGAAVAGCVFAGVGWLAGTSAKEVGEWAGWVSLGIVLASIPASWYLLRRFDRRVERELGGSGENPAPGGQQLTTVIPQGAD